MMQPLNVALIVSDSIIRLGMVGMIQQSNYADCKLTEFEDFDSFYTHDRDVYLLYYDISSIAIKDVEQHLRQLKKSFPRTQTVIIIKQLKALPIHRVQQLGAKGVIYRDELELVLLQSIDIVTRGVIVYSTQVHQLLNSSEQLYLAKELRDKDIDVLRLMAQGCLPKEIAHQLNVSPKTIYRIRDRLKDILNVPNAEMILGAALEQGLLDEDPP